MPYVPVPKDLATIKSKVAFNLTKRQLISFSLAGAVGFGTYFLTRNIIGNSGAVMCLMITALPFFFAGVYEKNGQPFEKVVMQYITAKFIRPQTRPYKTDNIYSALMKQSELEKEVERIVGAEKEKSAKAESIGK